MIECQIKHHSQRLNNRRENLRYEQRCELAARLYFTHGSLLLVGTHSKGYHLLLFLRDFACDDDFTDAMHTSRLGTITSLFVSCHSCKRVVPQTFI